jgi:predicted transcriptional regulator
MNEKNIIKELTRSPSTADEVQHKLNSQHQSNSAMFTSLKKRGVIEGTGTYRKTRMGRMAEVMRISEPSSLLDQFLRKE